MPGPHPPETIAAAVAEHERGLKGPVICRRYGISERTLYRWLRDVARARAEGGERLLGPAHRPGDQGHPRRPSARRVAVAAASRRLTAHIAPGFGVAPWLVVASAPDELRLVRNVGRTGASMVRALRGEACTDVVTLDLGARTRDRLERAGVRIWRGRDGASIREQLALLERGELERFPSSLVLLARR